MREVFGPISQPWMDHGFAFLTINYRGSTTFDCEFQEMIWGNPGHWEIADMAETRDLVRQRHRKRVHGSLSGSSR
jgi:dipeptidyl aminopeptidase/acylaminoacyl peptidase